MFPTPVGGLILPSEFAACIIFCVLYGLLLPLVAYRILNRRTRTFLLLGTILFGVERIVVFALRARATRRTSAQLSDGLLKYQQASFGLGYIGIATDLVNLLRCAIVNPTYGHERWDEAPASSSKDTLFRTPQEGEEDHPIQRRNMRSTAGLVSLAFLSSNIPGIIAGTMFHKHNFDNDEKAQRVQRLRYASAGVSLFLIGVIVACAAWSQRNQRRACMRALYTTYALASMIGTIAIYRLAVMWNTTPSLEYMGPGSLTSVGAKAAFYVLHCLPEWVAIACLLALPIRNIYGTGFWGDYRAKDDTEAEIAKRRAKKERKDAEKAARQAEERGNVADGIELRNVSSGHSSNPLVKKDNAEVSSTTIYA